MYKCIFSCKSNEIIKLSYLSFLFFFLFNSLAHYWHYCEIAIAGWFAKDPSILRRVGHVLLQVPFAVQRNPRQMIIADDCFQFLKISDRVVQVVVKATEKLYGSESTGRMV